MLIGIPLLKLIQVRQIAFGLTKTQFRVLWALRNEQRSELRFDLPAKFRITSNFPQLALIANKLVKMVISPCGMVRMRSALVSGRFEYV